MLDILADAVKLNNDSGAKKFYWQNGHAIN